MKNLFNKFNLDISDIQREKFEKYYELLVYYNSKFNITAITEKNEVIIKHFIDSALGYNKVNFGKVIDVGSGGGFPAIPLKIMNDDLDLTLLEATGNAGAGAANPLPTIIMLVLLVGMFWFMSRSNKKKEKEAAETLAKNEEYRESFDFCTARAVARLNTLCEYCIPFVKVGGKFVSYKGDADEEVNEAKTAVFKLGGKIKEVFKYDLDGAKRALITIENVSLTDKKYPRGNGKERKNPL